MVGHHSEAQTSERPPPHHTPTHPLQGSKEGQCQAPSQTPHRHKGTTDEAKLICIHNFLPAAAGGGNVPQVLGVDTLKEVDEESEHI